MPKRHPLAPPTGAAFAPPAVPPEKATHLEPHTDITSPDFVHRNDQMKHATKPNEGQPLSHRDRGKAGRKG